MDIKTVAKQENGFREQEIEIYYRFVGKSNKLRVPGKNPREALIHNNIFN